MDRLERTKQPERAQISKRGVIGGFILVSHRFHTPLGMGASARKATQISRLPDIETA